MPESNLIVEASEVDNICRTLIFVGAENNQVAEDGTLAASQHAPQTPLSEDASKTPRALSAAAAVASAGAATLVATQAAKDGALATKGLSFGDGNGSTLEGTRSGIVGKPSEMEGKALAAEWLAAQGSPVSVPRQQLTERGNDPLARVAVPETLEAVGGLELEKGVPSLGVGSSGVSSGSAIGGANLAPVSGAQADAKPVAQQPVLLSAAMEAEIERARGELEKIKAALAVAEGKKQKGLKERVSASKGAERKPELPGDGKGTSELHAGARELPTLVAGIEEPLEGHPGGKENAELVGEATNEGSAAIGAEAGGASENEIADLDARVESADPGDGKRGTPEKEGSAAGLTQEEGLPIEALAGTKSGFDAGAPETGTVKEVPAAQALKASSADGATVESGNDDLVGTVSPGTRRQNESEVEKAAPRRRVSFSDVETLHEIERMTAESGGGSATRLTASAPVGAGLGAGLRTGLAGPLAPIPEVNRTYSLSTGFGELQPHSRRRGISVESDAEQTRRETPTVLADPWESEAAQYEPKGRVEERGNASGKAGAVATGMGAGAAALLVARPMTGGFTEGAARVYAGLARTKSAEGMGTGLAEAQSKETVSVGSLGDENIKGSSLGPGEKAAVGEAVPEKEGASRSVAVESIGVPDAKESSAVGRRGPEPGVQGSGSTAGAEEVSSSPKRRSVAPSGWAAILGWPRSDEAKPAAPPVSTPLAATSGRGAEAAAKPEGLSRGIEMGRKGDALKVDAEMSVSGGMGESGPTKRTLAGVSSATTMVEPEELSREGSLDEKVGKSEVGTVEVGKKAQVAEVGSAEGAETVHVPKTGESFDNGLAVFGGEREKAEEDAQRRGESVEGGASAAAEVREIEAEAPSVAGPEEGPRRREGSAVGEGSEPPAIVMMGPVPAEGVVELGAAPEGQVMERGIDATVVDLRRGEESAVQRKVATREEGATDGIVPGGSTRKAVVEKASSGEEEEAAGSEGVPMPRRREGLALGPSFSLGRLAALSETRANLGAAGSPAVSSGIVANNVPQSITGGGSETGPGTTPQGSAGDAAVESGNARPVGVAAMPPVIPTETGDSIERIPVETVVGFLADGSIGKREERESPERRDVADIAFGGEANAPASGSPTEALRAKDDPGKPRQVLPTESTPPVVGASEGPVPQESVIPPSETETTGTEAGPSEAPEKQAYAPLTGGSVSVSPLVTSVAASAGAAEALRPAADVPAGVLATDDGAPNRAFTSSTPNSGLGKDLPTSGRVENESPKPRHVKKKLKASEGVTAGLLANPAGITELNPFSASKSAAEETSETKAFVRRAAGPKVPPSTEAASETSAQGVLIQEEALTQLSAPLSTSSVSQTTALKPTPNPLDSPSATSKTVEAPVDAASPANEIEEIAAVAPTTPPLHSKARRHRPKVEPLGGAKEDGARSAKSSGRSPAAVDDSPVRGLTRRPGELFRACIISQPVQARDWWRETRRLFWPGLCSNVIGDDFVLSPCWSHSGSKCIVGLNISSVLTPTFFCPIPFSGITAHSALSEPFNLGSLASQAFAQALYGPCHWQKALPPSMYPFQPLCLVVLNQKFFFCFCSGSASPDFLKHFTIAVLKKNLEM